MRTRSSRSFLHPRRNSFFRHQSFDYIHRAYFRQLNASPRLSSGIWAGLKYFPNARYSAENFDLSRESTADKHRPLRRCMPGETEKKVTKKGREKKKRQEFNEKKKEKTTGAPMAERWNKGRTHRRRWLEWKPSQVDTYEFSGLRRQHVRVLY